jgi:hypothetical protein
MGKIRMRTSTAVNLVKRGIRDGLTNDEIRALPQFKRLEADWKYRVNDKQIDRLRGLNVD